MAVHLNVLLDFALNVHFDVQDKDVEQVSQPVASPML